MFGLGPIYSLMIVSPRLVPRRRARGSAAACIATNVALAVLIVGALCWLVGWRDFLLCRARRRCSPGSAGSLALLRPAPVRGHLLGERATTGPTPTPRCAGSSYLKLPKVLQFFTGNIGLHHVHHLSARIPNYNLQRAHDENPIFHDVPTLSLWDGLRAVRLKLWDEEQGRLVTFAQARTHPPSRPPRRPMRPWPTATTSSSPTR